VSEHKATDRELVYIEKGTRVITNGPDIVPPPPTTPSGIVPEPAPTPAPK
jgi:hypothetical protein